MPAGIMGVAVSTGSFDQLTSHFGFEHFAQSCEDIVKERNLGLFVIISISIDEQGNSKKDLTFWRPATGGNDLTNKYDSL